MKVMINGVEIEIRGSSRLTYDVERDTLSVDPISVEKKAPEKIQKRAYVKRADKSDNKKQMNAIERLKHLPLSHEVDHKKLTQNELKEKIFEAIKNGDQPVAQQFITLQCLGKGSPIPDQKYFGLLLQQMSEDGELIRDVSTNRARYSIP